jgi:two-component system cell cycle response regulator DivK
VPSCKKILIVEDNARDRRLIRMVLNSPDYILLEACDGKQGLKLALEEKPDLIIMDVRMPGMDGLQITKILRATPGFEHTPIIAITAYAMKGDKEMVLDAGYSMYLSKPVHIKTLTQRVSDFLAD